MPCGAVKCMKTCYFRPKFMTLVQKLSHICKISPPRLSGPWFLCMFPYFGIVVFMHASMGCGWGGGRAKLVCNDDFAHMYLTRQTARTAGRAILATVLRRVR
eukprot:COSAG02_NODE_4886_length_4863_cov_9.058144_4_plen_102_part_00